MSDAQVRFVGTLQIAGIIHPHAGMEKVVLAALEEFETAVVLEWARKAMTGDPAAVALTEEILADLASRQRDDAPAQPVPALAPVAAKPKAFVSSTFEERFKSMHPELANLTLDSERREHVPRVDEADPEPVAEEPGSGSERVGDGDFSQPDDPYGIGAEYTSQSFATTSESQAEPAAEGEAQVGE